MERQVAENITIENLFERNKNGDFYAKVFEDYLNSGLSKEHIPVSPIELDSVNENNDNVYITEDVYQELAAIQDITQGTNRELPYFMIGWEKEDGSIEFNAIFSDKNQINTQSCDHNTITQYIENFLLELKSSDIQEMGKPIICKGHSHGKSNVSDNFSFDDMTNCITFKDDIRSYLRYNQNGVNPNLVDTTAMLLNPCGDFNMIYYDEGPENIGFYKFNNLRIKANNGDTIPLPTMSNDGNYIVNDIRNNIK